MFESSIDLVHDFENSDYPAADQRLILESGGWFLPVKPTAEELTAAETKPAKSRGHTRSSVSSRSSFVTDTVPTSSTASSGSYTATPIRERRWKTSATTVLDAALGCAIPASVYAGGRSTRAGGLTNCSFKNTKFQEHQVPQILG